MIDASPAAPLAARPPLRQAALMLRYLAHGQRRFDLQPLIPETRVNWEFYAVLRGRCAPLLPGQPEPRLRERTLWLFPPDHVHGWTGGSCEIVAFHFAVLPAIAEQIVRRRGPVERPLDNAGIRHLRELAERLKPHHEQPTELTPLHEQHALSDLCLLALEGVAARRIDTLPFSARDKVDRSLDLFRAALPARRSIEELAREVHASPGHLRRLYRQVLQQSPSAVLQRVVIERAVELLTTTTYPVDYVAAQCGFAGASEFTRAFKRHFKVPPAVWRASILPPYIPPQRDAATGALVAPQENNPIVTKLRRYKSRPAA